MHSPSALTEHVSLNFAGIFLLDPVAVTEEARVGGSGGRMKGPQRVTASLLTHANEIFPLPPVLLTLRLWLENCPPSL